MTSLVIYGSRTLSPTVEEIDRELENLGIHEPRLANRYGAVTGSLPQQLICGMEPRGADAAGYRWAQACGVAIIAMPADWSRYGKAAGPLRNRAMAERADVGLGWWDGRSTGTANMTAWLTALGKRVRVVVR